MEVLTDEACSEVKALCGGCCSCGTCHVYIDPLNTIDLDEAEEDELSLLEFQERYDISRSRLSCQIQLDDCHHGLRIQLIDNQA
jgi:2Fe-2S ferredoxin